MDASAYLHSQGWRGAGHSLDHTDRGIRKPLLVSKKVDVLGVGLDKHKAVSDQWWLRAYDQGLKDIGSGKVSALAQVQKHGVNRGGLYGRFVKGDGIGGTIGERALSSTDASTLATPETVTPAEPLDLAAEGDSMAIDMPSAELLTRKRKRAKTETETKKCARRKHERAGKEAKSVEATYENECEVHIAAIRQAEGEQKQKERKQNEAVQKAEIARRLAERNGEAQAGVTVFNDDRLSASRALESGTQDYAAHAQSKSKSGEKAQKYAREKLKRELKRAAKADLPGEKRTNREVQKSNMKARKLRPEKLKEYQRRADAKRIPLETYMKRRDEKFAAKQAEKLGNSCQAGSTAPNGGEANFIAAPATLSDANDASADELGFVVDTAGDAALSAHYAGSKVDGQPLSIEQYRGAPDTPVPLDPSIWEGQNVKDLPKAVRSARKQWMAQRREARKAAKANDARTAKQAKKARSRIKVEDSDAVARTLLTASRKAKGKAGLVDIRGVKDVPLVKVVSRKGEYSKEEMIAATRMAKRVLRDASRDEEADSKRFTKRYKRKKPLERERDRARRASSSYDGV